MHKRTRNSASAVQAGGATGCSLLSVGPIVLLSVILTMSTALLLFGCSGSSSDRSASSSELADSTQIANPIVTVESTDDLNDQLKVRLDVPDDVTIESTSVIDGTLGEVTFIFDNQRYIYRGMSAVEGEDISGLYYEFTSRMETTLNTQPCVLEFNESGPGLCQWYDEQAGIVYSISVGTGASYDKLVNMATVLIALQA